MTDKSKGKDTPKPTQTSNANPPQIGQQTGPQFSLLNIYMQDLSVESPFAPTVFQAEWKPKLNFDIQVSSAPLDEKEGVYNVTLHLTVSIHLLGFRGKPADDETTVYMVDLKQSGIFSIKNFETELKNRILTIECPTIIYPYARETISNMVARGGFPPLMLPHINFEGLYEQQHKDKSEEAKKAEGKR